MAKQAKKLSDYLPPLKEQGMDYLAGASQAGVSLQAFKVISAGTPDTVSFAALGLPDMDDPDYLVFVGGEGAFTVDESTITAQGFDILGGAASNVMHVLVVGKLKGQLS